MSTVRDHIAAFDRLELPAAPAWLAESRRRALTRFGELGFPTRRQETWRYTDLRRLEGAAHAAPGAEPAEIPMETPVAPWLLGQPSYRLVLVNGKLSPDLSDTGGLPHGVWLAGLAETLAKRPDLAPQAFDETDLVGGQPLSSLNAAFSTDGAVLALEDGVVLDRPIELINLGRGAAALHLRHLIRLGAGSRASVIETYAGEGSYWTNAVTLIRLGEGAELRHVKLQAESTQAMHLAQARLSFAKAGRYEGFALTLGALVSRQESLASLAGEGVHCQLDGAFLLRGEQEGNHITFVDHQAPQGTTRELWKGVAEDRAHGVFLGRIAVREGAQKTDAHQVNRNLLLSPRAAIDTKPELEILADDVKCAHGATVGDLDETALFYLASRGIPPAQARRILVDAFANEALERIGDKALRDHLGRHMQRWLGARETAQ